MSQKYRSKAPKNRINGNILLTLILVSSITTYILLQSILWHSIKQSAKRKNDQILIEQQTRLLANQIFAKLPTKTKSQESLHNIFFVRESQNPLHFYTTTTQNGLEDLGEIDMPQKSYKSFSAYVSVNPFLPAETKNEQTKDAHLLSQEPLISAQEPLDTTPSFGINPNIFFERWATLQNNSTSLNVSLFAPLIEMDTDAILLWNPYDRLLEGTWNILYHYEDLLIEATFEIIVPVDIKLAPGNVQRYPFPSEVKREKILKITICNYPNKPHDKLEFDTIPYQPKYSWPFEKGESLKNKVNFKILYPTQTWLQKIEASFDHDPKNITIFISNPNFIICREGNTDSNSNNVSWALKSRSHKMPADQFPYYTISDDKLDIQQVDVPALQIASHAETATHRCTCTMIVKPIYKEGKIAWKVENTHYSHRKIPKKKRKEQRILTDFF